MCYGLFVQGVQGLGLCRGFIGLYRVDGVYQGLGFIRFMGFMGFGVSGLGFQVQGFRKRPGKTVAELAWRLLPAFAAPEGPMRLGFRV